MLKVLTELMVNATRLAGSLCHTYLPRGVAIFTIALFAIMSYDYFHESSGDIWKGRWAGCGDFETLRPGIAQFDQDILSLRVTDNMPNNFVLSGTLELSKGTYTKAFREAKNAYVVLQPLPTNENFFLGFPFFIDIEITPQEVPDHPAHISFKLKEFKLPASGALNAFPFDDYRVGYVAKINVTPQGSQKAIGFPIGNVITNVSLSKAFQVKKAKSTAEFIRDIRAASDSPYDNNQCALVFTRPLWYQALVACLIILLFIPSVYLYYRKDADPGVELIAALIGAATVRVFLLGGSSDTWNFIAVDIFFAFAVLLAAAIPLWRLPKRGNSPCQ